MWNKSSTFDCTKFYKLESIIGAGEVGQESKQSYLDCSTLKAKAGDPWCKLATQTSFIDKFWLQMRDSASMNLLESS